MEKYILQVLEYNVTINRSEYYYYMNIYVI